MENNLGVHEKTIKASLGKYIFECMVIIVAVLIVILFKDFYQGKVVNGIPVVLGLLIISPVAFVISFIRAIMAIKNKTNIDIYENGLRIGNFQSMYQDMNFQKIIGPFKLNETYIFSNSNGKAVFKYRISKNDYEYINAKIKLAREEQPVLYIGDEKPELLPQSELLGCSVNIKVIREKSYIGSITDYLIFLNGQPLGGIMNNSSKLLTTNYTHNRITFSNNDVTKTIEFEILKDQNPVIVIKTNSYQLKKCTGCKVIMSE